MDPIINHLRELVREELKTKSVRRFCIETLTSSVSIDRFLVGQGIQKPTINNLLRYFGLRLELVKDAK